MPGASIREQVLVAFVAALNAPVGKPATAVRSAIDPVEARTEPPIFLVRARQESGRRVSANVSERKLMVRVEAHVAGAAPADALFDPLFVFAVQTVYQDTGLRALLRAIDNPLLDFEIEPAYADLAAAAIDFEVTFTHKADDPTAQFGAGMG